VRGGLWVGAESKIANIGGIRSDVVAALKQIRPGVLRWPGGCFADDYHWEDGIGPRAQRPKRVNLWWGHDVEDNGFGTHEFIQLCRLIGAEPYLAGNLGSGTVREMRDWVEYCNFPGASSLARQRAENGSPATFNVRYWGVGNEAWGCGGNFCAEDYATEYRRFATYLHDLGETKLFLIACGPDGNNPDWTRRFFQKLSGGDRRFNLRLHGFAAHYYCGTAGTATRYTTDQWYELLDRAAGVERLILEQRTLMDEFDPERRVGLMLDEWGTWHLPTEGRNPCHLWQQNTLRDALVAATTLDALNRNCDKVVMANVAQVANVLQAMVLTDEDKMLFTPTYHVFDLYQHHQGGKSVRVEAESPEVSFVVADQRRQMAVVSASASVMNNRVTLSVVNRHASLPMEVEISFCGGRVNHLSGRILCDAEITAHNTFEEPDRVVPRRIEVSLPRWSVPPASVSVLRGIVG